ncbi:uncharacterized protein LOC116933013 [Daphnia magna]|uniref:Uncharacterized protein n=1 Tax=Daphnia magna TaxID=35525 RepID=A0ABQ9ZPM5_9CRUS|nr:uncharacterized protein LOC116933013 [Daphnia magna]KAK4014887.1 hypothetical protein OUZ56_027396 [Daphnia magna]
MAISPIHPSETRRNRRKPCQAAGIFPIKPIGKLGRSCLPVPVLTGSTYRKPNKSNPSDFVHSGKSRIPVLKTQHTMHGSRIEALKKKEKELTIELIKTRTELERVEGLQKKLLVLKPTPIRRPKRRSKSLALGASFMDSPFTDSESPKIEKMSPLILSMTQSKNPRSLYETYRHTCKFLQTPRQSTFKLRSRASTPNNDTDISGRIQCQLENLFV